MKNIIVVVVVIALAGFGWYYATLPGAEAVPTDTAAMPLPGTDTPDTIVVREFSVTGSSFAFLPATMTVKKGETVRIVFKNSGGKHDWVLDEFTGARTKILDAGGTETIEFVADKAGTFEYYCSVGQHRASGMKGMLTVTE